MCGISNPPEKISGASSHLFLCRRDQISSAQVSQRLTSISRVSCPKSCMQVSDAASALLYVWLLKTHDSTKLCIPGVALTLDRRNKNISSPAPIFFESFQERVVDFVVAGQ